MSSYHSFVSEDGTRAGSFPGCMPDGDPSGPFATEQEAIDDANTR